MPQHLRRGAGRQDQRASVDSAVDMIHTIAREIGVPDLADTRILDIGCGVRFTQAFYGRDIPVKRYHGVELDPEMIGFLASNVKDRRFSYKHIAVYHEMYCRKGPPLTPEIDIGAAGQEFDLISLFSVFTHLAPADCQAMLALARKYISPDGHLIFTGFLDETAEGGFLDVVPGRPLLRAHYREELIRKYASAAHWSVTRIFRPPKQKHWIVCRPV
ncbi:MAG TPA: class I SAM-dependent methyltransferase [Rhizomicrobium sp.]